MDGLILDPITTVRNLGVIVDQDLSCNSHIKQIPRTAFFHLCNIAKIRHIIMPKDAEKIVHAFITSRLDYCNSQHSGCPQKSLKTLQLIENAAAWLLTRTSIRYHISPVLASLHWLPVKVRIDLENTPPHKAVHGQAPT